MLFSDATFNPWTVGDDRVRAAFLELMRRPAPLRPTEIISCALATDDFAIRQIVSKCISPSNTVSDLLTSCETCSPPFAAPLQHSLHSFTSAALKALREFEQLSADVDKASCSLEILVLCALRKLTSAELNAWQFFDVKRAIAECVAVTRAAPARELPLSETSTESGDDSVEDWPDRLHSYTNLTARVRAAGGRRMLSGDPQYGKFFDAFARAVHRESPRHILLVADRGVGQSLVLGEFALRCQAGDWPALRTLQVMLSDCRATDPLHSRTILVETLLALAKRQQWLFCIEGFSSLLRGERGGTNQASLLPLLSKIACRMVFCVTPREYDEFFTGDVELCESFTAIRLAEPSPDMAYEILRILSRGLEAKHSIAIHDEAIRKAVAISSDYALHDRLPTKALKLLTAVCDELAFDRRHHPMVDSVVLPQHVFRMYARIAGIPEESADANANYGDYLRDLESVVFGQEHAVQEVATELNLIRAGLCDADKPASVMLFIGQTGTGKTELAKELARLYSRSKRLRTFTLGNFSEPHSVSGIIGVPAGYVGHEQGGRIVNELNSDPYGVFLLDEADKAHPDVLQPFLNLFDEGWIVDQRGCKAFARHSIFILTTNVAQRQIGEMCRNGTSMDEIVSRVKETLGQIRHPKSSRPVFTPEFLARIKRIVVFRSLDELALISICRKLISGMQQKWTNSRLKELEIDEQIVLWLGAEAHRRNEKAQGREGGRIVRKLIADHLEAKLQREIRDRLHEYSSCRKIVVAADEPARLPEVQIRFLAT